MRRVLAIAALLLAGVAGATSAAVGPAGASTQTANHATANEPSAPTDGLSLAAVCGVRVIVSAAAGQTLSGAGTLKFWYWSAADSAWIENLTTTVSVTSTTRRQVTVDFEVLAKFGRIYVEADTVTVSSGALTVRIETSQCRN